MADTALKGLSADEAAAQLAKHGPNVLKQAVPRGAFTIVLGTLREPMFIFLLTAATLYLLVGDLGEGLFLLGGAALSVGLVVSQDARSEKALAALRQLAEPYARVIRDDIQHRIPARELVPGDIVLLGEGERIPADAVALTGDVLTVDESALTGESVPVSKFPQRDAASADTSARPQSDASLFAGTMLLKGQGLARITATGPNTQIGAIGAALTGESERTPLQITTGRLVVKLSVLAVVVCLMVTASYGFLRKDWFAGGLAGLTVAISLLPEEFPMVLAVFLAIGSWRLAGHHVLVRRAAVIETLGAVTMLCVDKTGTLTENRMKVEAIWTCGGPTMVDTENAAEPILTTALLASSPHPVDPMDRAIHATLKSRAIDMGAANSDKPVAIFPIKAGLLAVIQAWELGAGTLWAAKGAPEAILRLCALNPNEARPIEEALAAMAARGLRVLGVAKFESMTGANDDPEALKFDFVGLIGFLDPIRTEVPAALAEARAAGIDVAMITGDFPATALEIARQAGLNIEGGVMTGVEIAALSPTELTKRITTTRIFARVKPEQKLALVEAFKARGDIVAMTGDGINDAPALERAHIGIAMGLRGTDVAREAADLVLLDDSFASIVGGVRLGRRIFANLRKALTYVMAIHVPIAGVALLPIVFGMPPLLYPMHVVILELIIDPVSSLVFESEPSDKKSMRRPPRSINDPLFGRTQMWLAMIQGSIMLAAVLCLYIWSLKSGMTEDCARAMGFTALVVGNLALALSDASETSTRMFDPRHAIFWFVVLTAVIILSAAMTVPFMSKIFRLAAPEPAVLMIAIIVGVVAGGWYALVRRARPEWR